MEFKVVLECALDSEIVCGFEFGFGFGLEFEGRHWLLRVDVEGCGLVSVANPPARFETTSGFD